MSNAVIKLACSHINHGHRLSLASERVRGELNQPMPVK